MRKYPIQIEKKHVKMLWLLFILFVIIIFSTNIVSGQTAIIDSRCYLEGGGSAENFMASEDLAVGSIIGKLRINGNPNLENGDIFLTLSEQNAPVAITPGTKDIVLVTALDKENVNGPSSVYVNVKCHRVHSSDPSFVIPVNIRVTDVNDNAPKWIGAPYTLTLSEVTVPGTRILQGARATDDDQQGPFSTVEYQVLPGLYSDYVSFVSPLEGTLVLRKPLDYETLRNFTVILRAQDQGTPAQFSDTVLQVIVDDADDQNPKFLKSAYFGELPPGDRLGELKILPESIKAIDQDEGLRAILKYTIVPSPESRHFSINPRTGIVSLIAQLNPIDLLHPIILVIKATQLDNSDRYALTTLAVSKKEIAENRQNGRSNALTFLQRKFQIKVREDIPIGSRLLALPTNKPGIRTIQYKILNSNESNYFTMGPLGEIILKHPLDYEKSTKHMFSVMASDFGSSGSGNNGGQMNATTNIEIDVIDVNDWEPRFRQNNYEFLIPKNTLDNEPIALGKLEAADGDRNDIINYNVRGIQAHLFHVDSMGMLWLKSDKPNVSEIHLIATATDSGTPSRSTSVPVTIVTEELLLAETSKWTASVLGVFGAVLGIFMLIIMVMFCYIVRQKKQSKSRNNRISHGQSSTSTVTTTSSSTATNITAVSANLMKNHEKLNESLRMHNGNGNGANLRLIGLTQRPFSTSIQHSSNINNSNNNTHAHNNNHHTHGINGSGSTLSAGASTILAATLERDIQMERDRDNYTETVRSIISRASAARGGGNSTGQLFDTEDIDDDHDNEMDKDSISNSEIGNKAWYNNGTSDDHRTLHRCKKLSWNHEDDGDTTEGIAAVTAVSGSIGNLGRTADGIGPTGSQFNSIKNGKTELMGSTDEMGSTENHLTVYF